MLQYKHRYGCTGVVLNSDDRDIFDMLLSIFEINGGHFKTVDETTSKRSKWDREYYFTLREMAYIMEVTPERIRQIESKALRKLKHPSNSRQLRGLMYE